LPRTDKLIRGATLIRDKIAHLVGYKHTPGN